MMKPDPAKILLACQAEYSGGAPVFDRERFPAAAALIILGFVTIVGMFFCAVSGFITSLFVMFCIWVAGGTMFWAELFFPFHIGWVGVLIGLMSQPVLALIIVQGLMSGC
jgi:hypothetical protein